MTAVVPALVLALAFTLQAAPLQITDAGIREKEDGALIAPGTIFVPADVVFFSCQITGFQVSPAKKVAIEYVFSAVDPKGVAVIEPVSAKVDVELAPEDKNWKPRIRQTVLVPPLADSGAYKIRISAKDTVSGETSSVEIPFEVRGRVVEPSDTLVIRNFHFYRREEDSEPLSVAAYRQGDSVWARFDITGYKFGPENLRDAAYTVTVTAESGRVMLAPGEPSVDKGSSFYPMRYTPCAITFNLQPNIPKGEYTVLVRAQDRVGNQTSEWKQTFRVE